MRVLIVKTSSLGDIIHTFPVISFLHQEFPHIKIDWVVEKSCADIVKAHPGVNRVIEIDTKGWRKSLWRLKTWQDILRFRQELQVKEYHAVLDLQGNTKSSMSTFLARSCNKIGFGRQTIHEWPNLLVTHQRFNPPKHLNVRDENLYLVQNFFRRHVPLKNEKLILKLSDEQKSLYDTSWKQINEKLLGQKLLVCPGSAWKNKQLSFETLQEFLQKLFDQTEMNVILAWGTPAEFEIVQKLQQASKGKALILDRVPLPVLQNLMIQMDAVLAMDSLPLHLAGVSGVPTFSVFGASSALKYQPSGNEHKAIQGVCPYGKTFERRCPILRSCLTGLCMRSQSGDSLFKEFILWKKTICIKK